MKKYFVTTHRWKKKVSELGKNDLSQPSPKACHMWLFLTIKLQNVSRCAWVLIPFWFNIVRMLSPLVGQDACEVRWTSITRTTREDVRKSSSLVLYTSKVCIMTQILSNGTKSCHLESGAEYPQLKIAQSGYHSTVPGSPQQSLYKIEWLALHFFKTNLRHPWSPISHPLPTYWVSN